MVCIPHPKINIWKNALAQSLERSLSALFLFLYSKIDGDMCTLSWVFLENFVTQLTANLNCTYLYQCWSTKTKTIYRDTTLETLPLHFSYVNFCMRYAHQNLWSFSLPLVTIFISYRYFYCVHTDLIRI